MNEHRLAAPPQPTPGDVDAGSVTLLDDVARCSLIASDLLRRLRAVETAFLGDRPRPIATRGAVVIPFPVERAATPLQSVP